MVRRYFTVCRRAALTPSPSPSRGEGLGGEGRTRLSCKIGHSETLSYRKSNAVILRFAQNDRSHSVTSAVLHFAFGIRHSAFCIRHSAFCILHFAFCILHCQNSPAKWHAAQWPLRFSSKAGSCSLHRARAIQQRGWKRQPVGGLIGLGTSPWRTIRSRLAIGSGLGMAEIRALVYGCSGSRNRSSRLASSTSLPRYITPTRSEICSTTLRLCAMNR